MKPDWYQLRQAIVFWFETFLVFELVIHYKDLINPEIAIQAAIGAVLPIILRWANPKDPFPEKRKRRDKSNPH
jgi:hypothetical protein